MLSLFVGFLTVLMVVDCVLLVLLVLLQLPKKEAGAGLAFGGAATDALFGAGSGNVLTKITKYVAVGFFVLALSLATLTKFQTASSGGASLAEELSKKSSTQLIKIPSQTAPASPTPSSPSSGTLLEVPPPAVSNAPAPAAATNK